MAIIFIFQYNKKGQYNFKMEILKPNKKIYFSFNRHFLGDHSIVMKGCLSRVDTDYKNYYKFQIPRKALIVDLIILVFNCLNYT